MPHRVSSKPVSWYQKRRARFLVAAAHPREGQSAAQPRPLRQWYCLERIAVEESERRPGGFNVITVQRFFPSSSALQQYQASADRYGANLAPCFTICFGDGNFRLPKIFAKPLRTP